MAKKIDVEEEKVEEESENTFVAGIRRTLLASIGAMAVAQGEAEKFVNKLVEKGEIAEQDGRKLLKDLAERRKERAQESSQRVSDELEKRMETLLNRMNIPTKSDIDKLSKKIADLTKKVDALKKEEKKEA